MIMIESQETELVPHLDAIVSELKRSEIKHPGYPRNLVRRVAICVEEVGEAMKEALDCTRVSLDNTTGEVGSMDAPREFPSDLYKELVQTASTALKCMRALHREYNIRAVSEQRASFKHGVDCPKVKHLGNNYNHADNDDTPYAVDGLTYCGRCHTWLE